MIDLHSHSTASDGTCTPREVVRLAKVKKLAAVSLTDHDTIAGIPDAWDEAKKQGITFIPGCELSIDYKHPQKGSMHLLAYNFPLEPSSTFAQTLDYYQKARESRAEKIAQKMTEQGFPLSLEDILLESGNASVGKPHIAAAILKKGYSSPDTVYEEFLGSKSPMYVPKEKMTVEIALREINKVGALGVLAHPNTLNLPLAELDDLLAYLKGQGLYGMECHTTYRHNGNGVKEYRDLPTSLVSEYQALAAKHKLVLSGGSDFHGSVKPNVSLGTGAGTMHVPASYLKNFI